MVHIYNEILANLKKEQNCVIYRDVDGHRVCRTQWSNSEREKQILLHILTHVMWNLEKWYVYMHANMYVVCVCACVCTSVMSNSLWPYGL